MDNNVQNNAANFVKIKDVMKIQEVACTDVKEVTTEVTVIIVSCCIVYYILLINFIYSNITSK